MDPFVQEIISSYPDDMTVEEWGTLLRAWVSERDGAKRQYESHKALVEEAARRMIPVGQKSLQYEDLKLERVVKVEYSEIKLRRDYPEVADAVSDAIRREYEPKLTKTAIEAYLKGCTSISEDDKAAIRQGIAGDETVTYRVTPVKEARE